MREVARATCVRGSSPDKKRRQKSNGGKKHGPKPSKVAMISYHLPEMSKIPKNLKPQNAEVTRHMENGYGFRKIDSKGPCPDSLVVTDNAEDFRSYIHSAHPMLKEEDYFLYKLSKGRKLVELDVKTTRELKNLAFQGIIVVYAASNGQHPDSTPGTTQKKTGNHETIDMTELREQKLSEMSGTQEMLLERGEILSAIEYYKEHDIVRRKLYVSFLNEPGDDFMGLTREFFSEFWRNLLQVIPFKFRLSFRQEEGVGCEN